MLYFEPAQIGTKKIINLLCLLSYRLLIHRVLLYILKIKKEARYIGISKQYVNTYQFILIL